MIIIVSKSSDAHAKCIANKLTNIGKNVSILDMESLGNKYRILQLIDGKMMLSKASEYTLKGQDVESVWFRRPVSTRLQGISDRNTKNFVMQEWFQSFMGFLYSTNAKFVNSPLSQYYAVKPLQLHAAKKIGLKIPDTCITNDPEEAKIFINRFEGNVIHKSLTQPGDMLMHTKLWSNDDAKYLNNLTLAPTIFQREIIGYEDIRLTIVGEKIFSAKIKTSKNIVDTRLEDPIHYEKCEIPEEVANKLLELMKELGLLFGTIDMRLSNDGEYYFFEVNPQGQFLYIEIVTGLPISDTLSQYLTYK